MLHNKLYLPILAIIALLLIPNQSRPTKDIIECINKTQLIKQHQNLPGICNSDFNDKTCAKTVAGINQCLLLNDCLNSLTEEMDVHCWNCWADYTTDSHVVSSFQDQVKNCKFDHNLTTMFALVVLAFFALLY